MSDILFNAEIHDCDLVSRIEEQPAPEQADNELDEHDLRVAQAEWEAEQYEWTEDAIAWEEGMNPDELYDYDEFDELYGGEPIMDLPDDLFMIFDDPDYWG